MENKAIFFYPGQNYLSSLLLSVTLSSLTQKVVHLQCLLHLHSSVTSKNLKYNSWSPQETHRLTRETTVHLVQVTVLLTHSFTARDKQPANSMYFWDPGGLVIAFIERIYICAWGERLLCRIRTLDYESGDPQLCHHLPTQLITGEECSLYHLV